MFILDRVTNVSLDQSKSYKFLNCILGVLLPKRVNEILKGGKRNEY